MSGTHFSLHKEDWSLHRKGHQDQERHREKVKQAIKEHLSDLISDESIVMSDGRQIVKIPIRSLDEYRFRYNYNKSRQPGTGEGGSQVGDLIAKGRPDSQKTTGDQGAGDSPGVDYYEADVALEDIETLLFTELELPNLAPKAPQEIITADIEFRDIRKKGLLGNIDKKRTLLESIRRNQLHDTGKKQITPDDLRFKTWDEIIKPDSAAVVLALMDTSGSMGLFEKYCARTFFFWMSRFLKTKYQHVQIRYISHHTEAREVSEDHFFNKGESGGTICSSAYEYALGMIERDYPLNQYNLYPIHFSDGDNLASDNDKCTKLVTTLCEISQMFGYAEVNQYARNSSLMAAYGKIPAKTFRKVLIREKTDVYSALKTFFSVGDSGVKPA